MARVCTSKVDEYEKCTDFQYHYRFDLGVLASPHKSYTWSEFPRGFEPIAILRLLAQCNIHLSCDDLAIQQLKGKHIYMLSLSCLAKYSYFWINYPLREYGVSLADENVFQHRSAWNFRIVIGVILWRNPFIS